MNNLLRDQARELHKTVRLLRNRLIRQHASILALDEAKGDRPELSIAQVNTLLTIRDRGEMTMKELAGALEVSAPSASVMVDRLVELEMLRRTQSRLDRRAVRICLSADGMKIVDEMEDQLLEALVEILEQLGTEDATRWCEVYERVRRVLESDSGIAGVARSEGAEV